MVAYAYPDAFHGLRDLTIDRDLEHSGTLWETEIPLADAGPRLAGIDRVVGLTRQPDDPRAEVAVLEDRGFRPVSTSDHGEYRVWVFERLV